MRYQLFNLHQNSKRGTGILSPLVIQRWFRCRILNLNRLPSQIKKLRISRILNNSQVPKLLKEYSKRTLFEFWRRLLNKIVTRNKKNKKNRLQQFMVSNNIRSMIGGRNRRFNNKKILSSFSHRINFKGSKKHKSNQLMNNSNISSVHGIRINSGVLRNNNCNLSSYSKNQSNPSSTIHNSLINKCNTFKLMFKHQR